MTIKKTCATALAMMSFAGCTTCCCEKATETDYLGCWGLKHDYPDNNAGWLKVSKEEGKLVSDLLWRWASPFRTDKTTFENGELCVGWFINKGEKPAKADERWYRIVCRVCGDKLTYSMTIVDGNGRAVPEFAKSGNDGTGFRIPPIEGPAPDVSKAVYGPAIDLLKDGMDGWEPMGTTLKNCWKIEKGVLSNRVPRDKAGKQTEGGANLRTKRADFFDFALSYDVCVPAGCNSGVYLRGIYEIQTIDSYKKPVDCHNMAAFYGRITPKVAAEKPAGEWQHVDVVLYKRHVTVTLNGVKIIDNQPIEGVTGGALTADEFVKGPLYIQGDHSDADYRNMTLKPILR